MASVQPTTPLPAPAWERWALRVILTVFVIVGLNHIRTNTIYGQDFLLHSTATENLVANPSQWFPQDFTNRPLLYWIGAGTHWITHGKAAWEVAALVFIIFNTLALWLLHDSLRFLRSPALRIAALAFVAFLPSTQVAVIVYAADAVAVLPFVFVAWALLRALAATTFRGRCGYALLVALGLSIGNFARFTFIGLIPAIAVILALACRWRRQRWRDAALIAALALLVPLLLAGWIQRRAQHAFAGQKPHHTFNWPGNGEMTWSSLLWPKRTDTRILDAPIYWESATIDGQSRYLLLVNNSYSYPALLHLTIFTDVLDYAHEGQIDDGAARLEPQKTFSQWSVRLGLPFTLAALLAVGWLAFRCARALWRPALPPPDGVVTWGLMALAWYLPIALSLPFLTNAYEWGYWLSRLIIPALWGFSIVLFATIDELLARHRHLPGVIALLVAAQAYLHIASVWY